MNNSRDNLSAIIIATVFLLLVWILTLRIQIPQWVIIAYLWVSLVTFLVYAFDKWSARNSRWRTPEITLHMLSLLGGWPGALIAQRLLRHKSAKMSFLVVFWLSALANCAGLVWFTMENAVRYWPIGS